MNIAEVIQFCSEIGIPEKFVRDNWQRTGGDVSAVIDLWSSKGNQSPAAGTGGGQRPPQGAGGQIIVHPDVLDTALQGVLGDNAKKPQTEEDKQLQQALELSKQTANANNRGTGGGAVVDEDKAVQEAIAASLQTQKMDIDSTGASSDEMAMQKALEASILEAGGDPMAMTTVSNNPNHRKREDGIPVGLKNVGNTCYFNSLLQTYFYIPEIRRAVLSFPSDKLLADKQAKASTVEFMRELQRLFAYLILSNQRWVDPSALLKKLLDNSGQPVNIGNQEDVSEFNELFLTRISEGLALTGDLAKSKNSSDILKDMFQGSMIEFINSFELDGAPVESAQDNVVVAHLILPITEEPQDLHMCLESSMVGSLSEYATPKGHKTVAEQTRWFKRLPPVLMMQQNRVQFDQNTGTYRKLTTPLRFEKEITMDRYFLENRERTTHSRKIVNQWRAELAKRQKDITAIKRYKGRDHGLPQALESTLDYLKERMGLSEEDAKKLLPTVELLTSYHVAETERLNGLEAELKDYQEKIDGAYADYPNKASFSLFAVWVHAGVAGSGHYWAYMRCGKRPLKKEEPEGEKKPEEAEGKGKEKDNESEGVTQDADMKEKENTEREWIKLNDLKISDTNELEVMNQAIGGNGMSTAYFLIYMESSMFAKLQECTIPVAEEESKLVTSEIILKEIQEDNVKFLETLEKYNKSQNEDKVSRFLSQFENQQSSARSMAEEADATALERDGRIKSFYAFLYSIGLLEPLQYEIIIREYAYIFSRGLETDIGTSIYEKIQEKLGKDLLGAALQYKLEDIVPKALAADFKAFRQVAQYYNAGLNYFTEQRFDSAFAAFQRALEMDKTTSHPSAKRTIQIQSTINFFLQILLVEAERRCSPTEWQLALELFIAAAKGSLCVLSHFNPAGHAAIRDRLALIFNVKQYPMPLEAYHGLNRALQVLYIPLNSVEASSQIAPVARLADLGTDDEKWTSVFRNIMEKLDSLKVRYTELWHRFMPQPPPKDDKKAGAGDVAMPDLVDPKQ